jgi:hypothetical protein
MKALINGARKLNFEIEPDNIPAADSLLEIGTADLTEENGADLKRLWADRGIQEALQQQNQFQLYDSTE